MKQRAAVVAVAIAGLLAVAFASACDGPPLAQQPCRDIPDGGCPAYDNACEDPTCTALYLCEPNETWQLDLVCPPKEAGPAAPDATADAIADVVDHSDADYIDVPGALGGPGCDDLEVPDCALGVAAACTNGCCGCEDLYVCQSGGWSLYATCGNGAITLTPNGN
ncbi:MAG: hypothetical protein ABI461_01215 [Polyangiaceae bacterium]